MSEWRMVSNEDCLGRACIHTQLLESAKPNGFTEAKCVQQGGGQVSNTRLQQANYLQVKRLKLPYEEQVEV